MRGMTQLKTCPCGSSSTFENCCQPLLKKKKKALTAEQLLRSRYTAFTQGEVDYVLDTHHSRTKSEVKHEEIEEWSSGSTWHGLEVIRVEGGQEQDSSGKIIFCARFKPLKTEDGSEPTVQEHWEQSIFEKENGEWRFVDAQAVKTGTYVREAPKVGRNDACPCRSGKKYKKCCGAQ